MAASQPVRCVINRAPAKFNEALSLAGTRKAPLKFHLPEVRSHSEMFHIQLHISSCVTNRARSRLVNCRKSHGKYSNNHEYINIIDKIIFFII